MFKGIAMMVVVLGLGLSSCGGQQRPALTEDQAKQEVQQLLVLYKEARAKFVLQKQKLEQANDCGRATALKQAAKRWEDQANMQPGDTQDITNLRMELEQAEQNCRNRG